MNKLTDWDLIQRCQQGNDAAFDEIVTRYERLVFAVARRYGLRQEDAVDVAQQTFMQMIAQLDRFHADSRLKGWFGTVARRNAWRLLNQYDHEQVESLESIVEIGELIGLHHHDKLDETFVLEWLNAGLVQLDERCMQLVSDLYFERDTPSYDEIAAKLGIPKGSIGPTRKRCLAKLRKLLENSAETKTLNKTI